VLRYTRRQLALLFVVVAVGAAGLTIDRWRHANPDVVGYLETLDRVAPPTPEPLAPRSPARAAKAAQTSGPALHSAVGRHDAGRGRRVRADDATPLDVNLASAADFERLPGVGPALAARIVAVRVREGPFGSVDDLRHVRGIGDATLERLRPRLAINTP
jgi:competence protein ComEA